VRTFSWSFELGQHLVAHLRVALHDVHLVGGQRSGLGQDLVGHADLADVVQQGGEAQRARGPRRRRHNAAASTSV
jgi:hypothetical protein